MEIENLVYNLKIQEEFKIRQDKEILNMETEIENYKKNESQIKANHSNNYKTNLELQQKLGKVNSLLKLEKENNSKYMKTIEQNEFIISEACQKNEYLEKINNFYNYILSIFEEIIYNLSKFCENNLIFLSIQQLFSELHIFLSLNNNINFQNNILMKQNELPF